MQRIPPLDESKFNDKIFDLFKIVGEPGSSYNFTRWFINHPELATNWLHYNRALFEGKLSHKLRELIILKVADVQNSEYEWVEHVAIAKAIGFEDKHFEAIKMNDLSLFDDCEKACMQAVEQLCKSGDIDDQLWQKLAEHLDYQQQIELVFVIGSYTLMSWVIRVMRLPLESQVSSK